MTASTDDVLLVWIVNASNSGGSFLKSLAEAGLRADEDNYRLIRPVLLKMKEKYPQYAYIRPNIVKGE